ncbi:hypothetical protein BH24ACT4_BH24ACT4_12470 [soil metagenome]
MREERFENGGVPGRLYDPGDAQGLLLLGHGGGYSKDGDRFVALSRRYATETGLAVVCIDAVDHGERSSGPAGGALPARWHSRTAPQMVADWQTTATALASIGEAVAYVGFSMGAIFGMPTVASMPSIRAAVFMVGGIPAGGGIDDPPLRAMLLEAAAGLEHAQTLMLNMTKDGVFPTEGTHALFDAIPGRRKRLMFWEGEHNDWPAEAIRQSVAHITTRTS